MHWRRGGTDRLGGQRRRRTSQARAAYASIAVLAAATACAGTDLGAGPATSTPDGTTAPAATATAPATSAPTPPGSAPPPPAAPELELATGVLRTPTGVLVPIRGRYTDGRWSVTTPCNRSATLREGQQLASPSVLLDPGHGGTDEPGTVGPNGLREADLNLEVARRVGGWLQERGISVVLTRTTDHALALETRAAIATSLAPRAFVSIHHNGGPAGPSPIPGTVTFHQYDSPESQRLAGLLYQEVAAALAPLELPWVAGMPPGAMAVRHERGPDFYAVLRRTPGVASAIVEGGYLTNPPEAAAFATPLVQQLEAEAIGRAIVAFLTSGAPGSGFAPPQVFGTGAIPATPPARCVDPPLE